MSNYTQYKIKFNNDTGIKADSNIPLYLLYIQCIKNGISYSANKTQFQNETLLQADLNKETYLNWLIANSTESGGGSSNIRKFAMDSVNELICYCGYAPVGSAEDSAVWTITKIVTTVIGDADSTTTTNWKWTERETI